jgi:predicted transcriptional regulator/DNA-binding Lrp family transcriptional regulator
VLISNLLEDKDNLDIIESLVKGESVTVNYSELGRILEKNRGTVQNRVEKLLINNIIEPPSFPFYYIFSAYPLLMITNMDIPDCEECNPRIHKWIREETRIVASYKCEQGEYGSLIFSLHESLMRGHEWMANIPDVLEKQYNVEKTHATFNSNTIYVSNQLMLKYEPSTCVKILEREQEKGELELCGYPLDKLDLTIIKTLLSGEGIKYNRNKIHRQTGLHYKTIKKRVDTLLENKILLRPVCNFPNLFTPPGHLLSYMFLNVNYAEESEVNSLMRNVDMSVIWKSILSKYNMLGFHIHRDLNDLYGELTPSDRCYSIMENAQVRYLSPLPLKRFNFKDLSLDYITSQKEKIKNLKD